MKNISFLIDALQALTPHSDRCDSEDMAKVLERLLKLKEAEVTPTDSLHISKISDLLERRKYIGSFSRCWDRLFIAEGICGWFFFILHLAATFGVSHESILNFFIMLPFLIIPSLFVIGLSQEIYKITNSRVRNLVAFIINAVVFYFFATSPNLLHFILAIIPCYALVFWRDRRTLSKTHKQIAAACFAYWFMIMNPGK